jgi:hypothetical protein
MLTRVSPAKNLPTKAFIFLLALQGLTAQGATPNPPVLLSIDGQPVAQPPVPPVNPGGNVDLQRLSPTVLAADTAAYSALNVRGMAAGSAFSDPVSGVRTVKLTDANTGSGAQFYPMYSTLGLQISQAWGPNLDQYTIALEGSAGGFRLCDYKLGGQCTNFRSVPAQDARFSFSRKAGNERILYLLSGSQLRRYNTATNTFEDTAGFPYAWEAGSWLQFNHDETWATMNGSGGGVVTALNLSTRSVIRQTVSGLDEIYSGYNNAALINAGSGSLVWDLANNRLLPIGLPYGNLRTISHVASMRGFWTAIDTVTGTGKMPLFRIYEDGSHSAAVNIPGYWGQWHTSGHWQQAEGTSQYFLLSNWDMPSSGWTPAWRYALLFVRTSDGGVRHLGGHYSEGSGSDYYSQPHATQSHDGKLVVFGSNMLGGSRIDAFLMEVPTS